MTDTSFIENEERRALRKAVAEWASHYGAEYYLEKARAHEHTTELWSEAGISRVSLCMSGMHPLGHPG